MAIENVKQSLGQGGTKERPGKISMPEPREQKREPPKELTRSDIRQYLSKSNVELAGKTGLPSERREGLEKKWLPNQFGSRIQPGEIDRRISQLRDEKAFNERTGKWNVAKQIKKDIEGLETMKKDLFKK